MLSDEDLYPDTAWGILWAQRKKPRTRCQKRITWEGWGSSFQSNLSVKKMRQFSPFLCVLFWVWLIHTCVIYSEVMNRVKTSHRVDQLWTFCTSWVSISWPQEMRLLMLGLGFLPIKCFFAQKKQARSLGKTPSSQLHAREATALLMPGKISQFLLNNAWNMILFANSSPVLFFFSFPWLLLFTGIWIRTPHETRSKCFWQ